MAKKKPQLTDEQKQLANDCTKLQRETVIGVECYGLSQVKAYQKAGGKAKGRNAEVIASQILSYPKVKKFRESFAVESLSKSIMTREEALERLTLSARVRITDVCDFKNVKVGEDENGNDVYETVWTMKNAEDIPPEVAACIKSVTITRNGPKLELHDQLTATKQLAEMQGWNAAQKFEHTGKDGEPMKHDITAPEIASAIKDVAKLL